MDGVWAEGPQMLTSFCGSASETPGCCFQHTHSSRALQWTPTYYNFHLCEVIFWSRLQETSFYLYDTINYSHLIYLRDANLKPTSLVSQDNNCWSLLTSLKLLLYDLQQADYLYVATRVCSTTLQPFCTLISPLG